MFFEMIETIYCCNFYTLLLVGIPQTNMDCISFANFMKFLVKSTHDQSTLLPCCLQIKPYCPKCGH